MGCFGAHQNIDGKWLPCSSTKQFISTAIPLGIKSRVSLDDMREWSSRRKAKGKKKKRGWEKLKERRVLGIDSIPGVGLVSGNTASVVSGGRMPGITYGDVRPPNMSVKSAQADFSPRDNDPDVFYDIESARKRSRQLGCIGVSRRISKSGKTVWMPCTNIVDYNNLTGMTDLGRRNLAKRNEKIVRTIVKDDLKKRKKSILEEMYGKALGPKLRAAGRGITSRFDPKAWDGDSDGLVQDATPFQRPAIPGVNDFSTGGRVDTRRAMASSSGPVKPTSSVEAVAGEVVSPDELPNRTMSIVEKAALSAVGKGGNSAQLVSDIKKVLTNITDKKLKDSVGTSVSNARKQLVELLSDEKFIEQFDSEVKLAGFIDDIQMLVERMLDAHLSSSRKTETSSSIEEIEEIIDNAKSDFGDAIEKINSRALDFWKKRKKTGSKNKTPDEAKEKAKQDRNALMAALRAGGDPTYLASILGPMDGVSMTPQQKQKLISGEMSVDDLYYEIERAIEGIVENDPSIDAEEIVNELAEAVRAGASREKANPLIVALAKEFGDEKITSGDVIDLLNVTRRDSPFRPDRGKVEKENIRGLASRVSSVNSWLQSSSREDRENLFGDPIEMYDVVPNRGMASRKQTGRTIIPRTRKQRPTRIDGLDNPDASPTNPLRNVGGKSMGMIIRGLVKQKYRNKKDRTTYIIGGNIGAGKSTVLEEHLVPEGIVPSREEAATIDPDFIKLGLPGYDDGAGARRVHGESQRSTDLTIRDAADDGMDMVITGSGASRQRNHIREAKERGEKVVGHYVHVPAPEAAKRIRSRASDMGRQIDDNTSHMARSIPRSVADAINSGDMDEFYLWDNDVPPGQKPKLIASMKNGSLEVFDEEKFDEFMAGNKINSPSNADGKDSETRGMRSARTSYDKSQVIEWLKDMGFDQTRNHPTVKIGLPSGSRILKFWEKYVKPYVDNKTGRTTTHDGGDDGFAVIKDMLLYLGIPLAADRMTDKYYRNKIKKILRGDDVQGYVNLMVGMRIPLTGADEAEWKQLVGEKVPRRIKIDNFEIEIDTGEEPTIGRAARDKGFSEEEIQRIMDAGWTLEQIEDLSAEEIREILSMVNEE